MTLAAVGAWWLLTAAGGGLLLGLVRIPMRLEERLAVAAVGGIVLGALFSLLVAIALGMGWGAVVAGPVLLIGVAGGLGLAAGDPRRPWRESWQDARARGRSGLWPIGLLAAVATVGFAVAFAHGLFPGDGGIEAGYPTVWSDWSLHASAASSFAVGHNLPPHDPIFSGTAYRYPFLPDYSAAMLLALGTSMRFALEAPNVVLCVAITVIVGSLAQRICGLVSVGVVAMAVVLLGGGAGVTGLWWDSCRAGGYADSQCDPGRLAVHPVEAVTVTARVARSSLDVVRDQPRPYDALLAAPGQAPIGSSQQWYTPLLTWWLPQRTFVYGFAVTLSVLLLVHLGLTRAPPAASAFRLAGLLTGLLPLIHVHSFIALAVVLPLIALVRRRREWLDLAGVALLVALPRVVSIAAGGHGTVNGPYGDNSFPFLEPGWRWNTDPAWARVHVSLGAIPGAVGRAILVAFTPGFWGFWMLNVGVLVPICAVAVAVALVRRRPAGRLRSLAGRLRGALPDDLLLLCLPLLALFPIANLVVFQEWDWDNTKLFAYWQLGAALLAGAWIVAWFRRRGWRAVAAVVALVSLIGTGSLSMLRYLPWTSPANSPGPYTWASADALRFAAAVETATPRDAVFVTAFEPVGAVNDPVVTIAGRSTVLGYVGWLNSYGTDFGTRVEDVRTIYAGCPGGDPGCPVYGLLHRYRVDFVRIGPPEIEQFQPDRTWWNGRYPVVARGDGTVVYDVRRS